MKILIVIDSLGGGGAERSTQVLCDYLAQQKVSFKIVCLYYYPNGYHEEMLSKGYEIQFLKKKSFIGQVSEISHIIKAGEFDLVHSILFKSNIRTRFAKIFGNFTHLESLVNTTYSEERKLDAKVNQRILGLYKILDRYTARYYVDHFHAITKTVKSHYSKEIGIDLAKITIVYRGREPLEIINYNEHPNNNEFILLNVARQDYQKGQIFLLEAMKKLKEIGETQIKLINIGVKGSESINLEEYISKFDLKATVSFEGFSNDVAKYYSIADVFIFSSLFEGLGGALIEAQSAGLPIISNDLEVLREVVQKDINGLFVNIKDTEELVNAILTMKRSPELREKFSQESFINYNKKFRQETSNSKMLELYQRLC